MIAKMAKYDFVLYAAQSEDFIEKLRELGLVDITTTGWEPSEEDPVFGAYDLKAGCIDSAVRLCDIPLDNKPEIYCGIYEEECLSLLREFFGNLR